MSATAAVGAVADVVLGDAGDLTMTGVVSTYKECLRHLKELQDGSDSPEAAGAPYAQVASKCNKLQQGQHNPPPKGTWKKLVLEMQASVARVMVLIVGLVGIKLSCAASCVLLHAGCSCAGCEKHSVRFATFDLYHTLCCWL
jgi:hypothetical protein